MESVMKLCSDLQQNATPFQISVKVVGSVDFYLSTIPGEQEANESSRSGSNWRQRGPSYLRRQLKRCLEKKMRTSQKGEEEVLTGKADEGGGSSYSSGSAPSTMPHVSVGKTAQNLDSQLNVTNSDDPEVEVDSLLGGEIGQKWEEGRGRDDVVERRTERRSDKRISDLEARMRRIRAEMRVHRQILHGTMTAFSEKVHPIYNVDHGAHHFYMDVDYVDSQIKQFRENFGFPDVASERKWLKDICDYEGIEIPQKLFQRLQTCWRSDDMCLHCNQRKSRIYNHDCNLRYDENANDFLPK